MGTGGLPWGGGEGQKVRMGEGDDDYDRAVGVGEEAGEEDTALEHPLVTSQTLNSKFKRQRLCIYAPYFYGIDPKHPG